MAAGPARGPKEINQTNIALQDVTQKVRFPSANVNGRTPPGFATANGMVPIQPGTTYLLTTAATGVHIFLSRADVNNSPGAAAATDTFIPAASMFTFFSGEYDQLSADGTTGTLTPLAL